MAQPLTIEARHTELITAARGAENENGVQLDTKPAHPLVGQFIERVWDRMAKALT